MRCRARCAASGTEASPGGIAGVEGAPVCQVGLGVPTPRWADGVALHFVGERARLSPKVAAGMARAQAETAGNTRLVLNVCFNYGGRWDIAQAAAKVAAQGLVMTEANLDAAMALAHVPPPDLIIRTGGEQRLSNFLLWQAAYAELYFSDKLWTEFGVAVAAGACDSPFASRRSWARAAGCARSHERFWPLSSLAARGAC